MLPHQREACDYGLEQFAEIIRTDSTRRVCWFELPDADPVEPAPVVPPPAVVPPAVVPPAVLPAVPERDEVLPDMPALESSRPLISTW